MLRFYLHAIIIAFILCLIFGPTTYGSNSSSDLQDNKSLSHISLTQNWLNSNHRTYLITYEQRPYYKDMLDEMFKKRYEVFYERLGWDLPVKDQRDIDQYDIREAVYLIYHDRRYGVVGGLRMLPTTSTYMLKDTFSHLVDHKPEHMPVSPKVWEATRFFFCKPKDVNDYSKFARQGTLELVLAVQEFALTWNLNKIIAVTDPHVEKIVQNIGWDYKRMAEPKNIQGKPVVVLNLTVSQDNLKRMRQKSGINTPVLWTALPLVTTRSDNSSQHQAEPQEDKNVFRRSAL